MERLPKEVSTTIMLAVFRSGKLTMSEIYEKTRFSTITILNHVNSLVKAGLLKEEREGSFPKRRIIRLTPEGAKMASLLNTADKGGYGISDYVDMGAKAGRIAAYQEGLRSIRKPNSTREYLMAEMLVREVGALSNGLAVLAKGLPEEMGNRIGLMKELSAKLDTCNAEGQRHLAANDPAKGIGVASRAFEELEKSASVLMDIAKAFREMRLDELANYLEFLTPRTTQKE